jgi:hypothetical protein
MGQKLGFHYDGRTYVEWVWEQSVEEIFQPKRQEDAWGRRKLHNEKLRNLYSSPNIISVVRSKRVRWAGHVAHGRDVKYMQECSRENPKGTYHSADLVTGGRILRWMLKCGGGGGVGAGFNGLKLVSIRGPFCGFRKGGRFLDEPKWLLASQEGVAYTPRRFITSFLTYAS